MPQLRPQFVGLRIGLPLRSDGVHLVGAAVPVPGSELADLALPCLVCGVGIEVEGG